jgi:hypothetical protein
LEGICAAPEKLQLVLRKLKELTVQSHITTLDLSHCEMKEKDTERFARVLEQCPALVHLDLSGNRFVGTAGAERLAGVLGQ